MKRLLGPMALLCFVACSNPISPHSESIQSYHSQNTLCNSLRFDQPTVSGADLRAIVSCLNSNHELEPLSNLVNTLSSDDLTAGASLFNDAAKNHPQDLFTVRESYRYLTKNGELPALEKQFQGLLSDPKYADSFSKILTRTSDLVSEIVFSPEHTFDPEGFYFLSKLPAFKRLSSEFLSGPSTEKVLGLLSNYFADPRHRSFKRLYQLSRAHALSSRWNDLLKSEPKVHLQNLAHFFDWLVSGGNFEFISKNIEDLKTLPVQCFNQSKTIDQPLFTVLSKIQAMSSSEAALFLSHDIKNLYLVSQAYCSYPVKFSALIAKVEEGTKIPGYTEIFSLIQPFLQDDDFISLVADPSSRDLFFGCGVGKRHSLFYRPIFYH